MSATERLRAMLDKRETEYGTDDAETVKATRWTFGENGSAMFTEYDDDECVFVTSGHVWTPEQAIAATLGRGTCKDVGEGMFECSECGCSIDLEDVASCEPTMWVDGVASVPRFCPNCGRAVARDA